MSGPVVIQTAAPAYWASYLVNGDSSGLDQREIDLADKWQAGHAPAYVVSVATDENGLHESPYFSWHYGLISGDDSCGGGELVDYILHAPAMADLGALLS
jgi:hypothetical protein